MNALSLDQIADAVSSAFPKLSEQEQRVTLAIYRLLGKGHPVTADEISHASGVPPEAVAQMLATWHGVERNADGAVTAFCGLTLSKTKHLFRINGRELRTWCAWDTLFLPPLLGAAADVEHVFRLGVLAERHCRKHRRAARCGWRLALRRGLARLADRVSARPSLPSLGRAGISRLVHRPSYCAGGALA